MERIFTLSYDQFATEAEPLFTRWMQTRGKVAKEDAKNALMAFCFLWHADRPRRRRQTQAWLDRQFDRFAVS